MNGGNFDPGSIPPDALASAIAKISEHPELISIVAGALGKNPSTESEPKEAPLAPASDPSGDITSIIGAVAPVMSALGGSRKKSPREEHRDALLCALKPYLSEDRRQMVDHIIKLGQIGDILKIIK